MSANFRVPQLSVAEAVGMAKMERIKRGVMRQNGRLGREKDRGTILMVPTWIKRYPLAYAKIRRMRTQERIDTAVEHMARLTGRKVEAFGAARTSIKFADTEGHGSVEVKRDAKRVTNRDWR